MASWLHRTRGPLIAIGLIVASWVALAEFRRQAAIRFVESRFAEFEPPAPTFQVPIEQFVANPLREEFIVETETLGLDLEFNFTRNEWGVSRSFDPD